MKKKIFIGLIIILGLFLIIGYGYTKKQQQIVLEEMLEENEATLAILKEYYASYVELVEPILDKNMPTEDKIKYILSLENNEKRLDMKKIATTDLSGVVYKNNRVWINNANDDDKNLESLIESLKVSIRYMDTNEIYTILELNNIGLGLSYQQAVENMEEKWGYDIYLSNEIDARMLIEADAKEDDIKKMSEIKKEYYEAYYTLTEPLFEEYETYGKLAEWGMDLKNSEEIKILDDKKKETDELFMKINVENNLSEYIEDEKRKIYQSRAGLDRIIEFTENNDIQNTTKEKKIEFELLLAAVKLNYEYK